jgi:ribosome maturation factor RimP
MTCFLMLNLPEYNAKPEKCWLIRGFACYTFNDFFVGTVLARERMGFWPIFYLYFDMQLAELIEKTVDGLGFELVEFETSPRARLLRIFIDKPEGAESGITIDDCALVSSQLSRVFLVENVDYDRLEVSSPGMDRPLVKVDDYRRFAGAHVQIKLRVPVANQRNFSGVLVGLVAGESPVIALLAGDIRHEFAVDNIDRARLIPKF